MILIIQIVGMVVSIAIDWWCYSSVKDGADIENYPEEYLKYNKYELFRSWALWSVLWSLILVMIIVKNILKWVKK